MQYTAPNKQNFPFSIVWTTIPGLSWFLPVGHVGICDSQGSIYDFMGRGPVNKGELGFGQPKKRTNLYYQGLNPAIWDKAIQQASLEFSQTDHSLLSNNCHHHVARTLNLASYRGKTNWSGFDIASLARSGQKIKNI